MKKGDWVATANGFRIARVKELYRDGEWVDLILYSFKGDRVGRESPPCGGPTTFEPAMAKVDWKVIRPPRFPLRQGVRIQSGRMISYYPVEFVE